MPPGVLATLTAPLPTQEHTKNSAFCLYLCSAAAWSPARPWRRNLAARTCTPGYLTSHPNWLMDHPVPPSASPLPARYSR
ncbi:Os05g0212350 [Oryza sativa Japonica Group]|uniref:Os05g0212350 protein n=1 Tax=Oryza sativa subsp. japonica TaxID=39947 RepID=A0A0P0WJE5_ORYSJ|nr:hypothetical protein EE612_027838 [Oryza sativa]BAS92804.1 Os05g0212350 [Oryza sativa Japonica Group]